MKTDVQIEKLLGEILAKHNAKGESLLALIKRERRFIIHADLEGLKSATQEKITLKEEITSLEELRLKLMPYFVKAYGFDSSAIQLNAIIEKVDEPYATQYRKLQKKLRKTFNAIQRVHDGNKILIRRSVAFQEQSFMLLYGLTNNQVRYEKNGHVTHDRKPLIDSVM